MAKFKVLIVEDDAIEALDIQKRLEALGYEVPYVASRGQEAIEKSSELKPDIVLMDINLKGEMDGLKAASEIIQLEIPIIYVTALSNESIIKKAKLTEPYGYIIKPYDPEELKFTLEIAIYKSKNDKKLKESEKISKAILNASDDSLFLIDTKGKFISVNKATTERLGYSEEELIGTNFKKYIDPQIAESRWKYVEKAIKTKNPVEFHDERNGMYFHHRINPIVEENKVKKIAIYSQDRTKEKLAEIELNESEKDYKTIFNNIGSGTVLFNNNGLILMVNSEWEKISGYSREEVEMKMTWMDLIHPDYLELMTNFHEKRELNYPSVSSKYEAAFIKKTGEIVDMYVSVMPMPENDKWLASAIDITNLKKTQEKLVESEKRLNFALDGANAALFDWDVKKGSAYFPPEYYEQVGYEPGDFPSTYDGWSSIIHPEDHEKTLESLQNQIKNKLDQLQIEYRVLGKDNCVKWILGIAKGVEFDDDGSIIRIIGLNMDITERKRLEKNLKESQRKLETLMSNLPGIAYRCKNDSQWTMEFVSEGCLELTGYSSQDLINNQKVSYASLIHDDDQKGVWDNIQDALAKKEYFHLEYRITTADSKIKYVLENGTGVFSESGELLALEGFISDITEQKKTEKSLKEQYEFLQNFMDSIPSPIFYKDANYRYQGYNNAFKKFLGVSKSLIGKTVYDINPPELADKFHEKDRELFETPGTQIYEAPVQYGDGSIHEILFVKNTFYNPEGELAGLIGVMSDITEMKKAEEALKISEQEYREVLENMNTAVAVYEAVENGSNFVFKDFNPAGAKIEKVNRKKIIGKKITEVFPGIVDFGLLEVLKRVWKTGTPEKFPLSFYQDERISGWRQNYVYRLHSGEVVCVYDDLTLQKQAEEEIKQNQERLKSLVKILQYDFNSISDLLEYALDEAIKLTKSKLGYLYYNYTNKEHFIMNNNSKEEIEEFSNREPRKIYEFEKPGNWGESLHQKKPIIINDFQERNMLSYPLKKGYSEDYAPIYKLMTLPVFSKEEIVAVVGVANKDTDYNNTDLIQLELLMDAVWKIVDRQIAEEGLMKSETEYKAIFENTGTATAISKDNMVLSLVNEEFCQLTGYSKEDVENKMKWTEFFVEDHLDRMEKYHRLRRVDAKKAPQNYESKVRDKEGYVKDVYLSVAMIPNTSNSLVSLLDITEKKQSRKLLEKELKIEKALENIYSPIVSPNTSIEDISVAVLKESLNLTGSKQGYVSTIDLKTGDNIAHSLTRMMPDCKVIPSKRNITFSKRPDGTYGGLWGYSLNIGKSFFTSDPQTHESSTGVPEGHIELKSFLSVPVFLGKELVGQIALANSENEYSKSDTDAIERIAEFFALAIRSKYAEQEIINSLEEKETLLREIHHRVKNNMQIISSLLNLQKYWDSDRKPVELIEDSQNRIKTMSIVHELLYQSEKLSKVNLKIYIEKLTRYLFEQFSASEKKISLITDLEENYLNIETAVPCCLIVNELVSNSLKHAFPSGNGTINILFHKLNGKYELIVNDNGIGLSPNFKLKNNTSLGLYLVNNLVKQIDGKLEIKNKDGAEFKIIFEELIYKKRF